MPTGERRQHKRKEIFGNSPEREKQPRRAKTKPSPRGRDSSPAGTVASSVQNGSAEDAATAATVSVACLGPVSPATTQVLGSQQATPRSETRLCGTEGQADESSPKMCLLPSLAPLAPASTAGAASVQTDAPTPALLPGLLDAVTTSCSVLPASVPDMFKATPQQLRVLKLLQLQHEQPQQPASGGYHAVLAAKLAAKAPHAGSTGLSPYVASADATKHDASNRADTAASIGVMSAKSESRADSSPAWVGALEMPRKAPGLIELLAASAEVEADSDMANGAACQADHAVLDTAYVQGVGRSGAVLSQPRNPRSALEAAAPVHISVTTPAPAPQHALAHTPVTQSRRESAQKPASTFKIDMASCGAGLALQFAGSPQQV